MKKLALLTMAVGGLLGLGSMGGCVASTAYTGEENTGRMARTFDLELKQAVDEVMFQTMLMPPSHTSVWNLR